MIGDAYAALKTNKEFSRYFHKHYKRDQGMEGGKGARNSNMDEDAVVEAWVEWSTGNAP